MPLIGNARGRPDDWRGIAWGSMAIATMILVLDASTLVRVHDFESRPPPVMQVEARIRNQSVRKTSMGLHVETSSGGVLLTTGPATVFGSVRSDVESRRVLQDRPAKVAWIDAPAGIFYGTIHYPIRIEQEGAILLQLDGPAGVAKAQRTDLLQEVLVVGITMFAIPALLLMVARRRDHARRAALSAAFRERRLRDGERSPSR